MKNRAALVRLILGLFIFAFGALLVGFEFLIGAIYAGEAVLPLLAIGVLVVVVGGLVMLTADRT